MDRVVNRIKSFWIPCTILQISLYIQKFTFSYNESRESKFTSVDDEFFFLGSHIGLFFLSFYNHMISLSIDVLIINFSHTHIYIFTHVFKGNQSLWQCIVPPQTEEWCDPPFLYISVPVWQAWFSMEPLRVGHGHSLSLDHSTERQLSIQWANYIKD